MTDMIERVARAIYERGSWGRIGLKTLDGTAYTDKISWDGAANKWRGKCMKLAHAAVLAMREPTEAMMRAAFFQANKFDSFPTPKPIKEAWPDMIDTALTQTRSEGG